MSEVQDVWSLIWKIGEYAIGIITAIAAFIIKGYHDEFKQLKAESQSTREAIIKIEQTIAHIDKNITNWDNGSRAMLKDIETLESEFHELKERVVRLETINNGKKTN